MTSSSSTSSSSSIPLTIPKTRPLTGGDLLAQCLQHLGVTVTFGLHGGHLDAFLVGCAEIGIRLIDTRHETAAVQAAEGYSKVAGGVGVCFVTANSGFSNGIPGLATAFADRSSILCITSSAPLRDAETNCLQDAHDQVVVAKPITRFAYRITKVEEIPRVVSYAWRVAGSAAMPGPVLLDFPIDVLFSLVEPKRISWGSITSPLPLPPAPHPTAVTEALSLLKSAKRPVIIVGTGCRAASTITALTTFAETTQTPIFYSYKFSTTFPFTHPLHAGLANLLAYLPHINSPIPDLILLLGARTGMFLGGRGGSILPNDHAACKLIQVDTDGAEIGRSLPIDLGIVSTTENFLLAATKELSVSKTPVKASEEWVRTATSLKKLPAPHDSEPEETTPGRPHPYHALKALFSALPAGSIISTDGGDCNSWAAGLAPSCNPHLIMFASGYMGFLGNGFGYALGCAVAEPERLVVNIQGDGSAGMHLMELDTYARFKLRVLTVVCNNYKWGMSANGQDEIYGGGWSAVRPASVLSEKTAYEVVARGLGNASARVDRVGEVAGTVRRVLEEAEKGEKAACINLIISDKPTHPGTLAMVGRSDDENVMVIPYYDNIPRPFYRD